MDNLYAIVVVVIIIIIIIIIIIRCELFAPILTADIFTEF